MTHSKLKTPAKKKLKYSKVFSYVSLILAYLIDITIVFARIHKVINVSNQRFSAIEYQNFLIPFGGAYCLNGSFFLIIILWISIHLFLRFSDKHVSKFFDCFDFIEIINDYADK
jgi:hypothetical protein